MQKSYPLFFVLLALALMCAACIERSASVAGNGTKLLNDTWLGDKLDFSQRSLAPLDFFGEFVTFIGTVEMPLMLLAADDGNENEGESEVRAKKSDDKDDDDGADDKDKYNDDQKGKDEGGWDRLWDTPTLG